MARGDLATAFHEAGHVAAAWSRGLKIHGATIDPTPGFRGHTLHANPWRGIRFNLRLPAFATVQNPRSSYTLQALKRSSGINRAPGAPIMGLPISSRHSTWLWELSSLRRGGACLSRLADGRGPRRDRRRCGRTSRRSPRRSLRERTLTAAEIKILLASTARLCSAASVIVGKYRRPTRATPWLQKIAKTSAIPFGSLDLLCGGQAAKSRVRRFHPCDGHSLVVPSHCAQGAKEADWQGGLWPRHSRDRWIRDRLARRFGRRGLQPCRAPPSQAGPDQRADRGACIRFESGVSTNHPFPASPPGFR